MHEKQVHGAAIVNSSFQKKKQRAPAKQVITTNKKLPSTSTAVSGNPLTPRLLSQQLKEKLYTPVRSAGESHLSKQEGSSWGRNFCDNPTTATAFGMGAPASLPHWTSPTDAAPLPPEALRTFCLCRQPALPPLRCRALAPAHLWCLQEETLLAAFNSGDDPLIGSPPTWRTQRAQRTGPCCRTAPEFSAERLPDKVKKWRCEQGPEPLPLPFLSAPSTSPQSHAPLLQQSPISAT